MSPKASGGVQEGLFYSPMFIFNDVSVGYITELAAQPLASRLEGRRSPPDWSLSDVVLQTGHIAWRP